MSEEEKQKYLEEKPSSEDVMTYNLGSTLSEAADVLRTLMNRRQP